MAERTSVTGGNARLPSLNEIATRLLLAVLSVGAVVLLGLWLRTGSLLDWFSTALIVALSTPVHGSTRTGKRIDKSRQTLTTRLQPLVETINEVTWLRPLTSILAVRIVAALGLGAAVATVEQLIVNYVLRQIGVPDPIASVLGLAMVLFCVYAAAGWFMTPTDPDQTTWGQRLTAGLQRTIGIEHASPLSRALLMAGFRTAFGVLLRSLALLVLPAIYDNPYAIGFFAVLSVLLIIAADFVVDAVRRALRRHAPGHPVDRPDRGTVSESD